ncbi:hypothetical protein TFLX_00237 [Thermoflexales bacterium]|nr:hypothetical protein TFLX_00237 [Thermoflexales bacterium]
MTIVSSSPKWAFIGERVCAIYFAVIAIAYPILVLIGVSNRTFAGTLGLLLLIFIPGALIFGLTASKLWVLWSWARASASEIFAFHPLALLFPFMNLLTSPAKVELSDFLFGTIWAIVGIIGWLFLNRPAVKALFENHK